MAAPKRYLQRDPHWEGGLKGYHNKNSSRGLGLLITGMDTYMCIM